MSFSLRRTLALPSWAGGRSPALGVATAFANNRLSATFATVRPDAPPTPPRGRQPALTIGLMPADGIGLEVMPAAQRVLEAVSHHHLPTDPAFRFIDLRAGFEHFQATGSALPDATLDALRNVCDGAIFGSVSSPSHAVRGYSSPIVKLRKELDLFANVRPIVSVSAKGANTDEKQIDMVIVRENTECLYVKQERVSIGADGLRVAVADRVITERASQRIARAAFRVALQRVAAGRKATPKVTVVHKSNVLSVTDGLFREAVRAVQQEDSAFQDIVLEEQLVDSMVYRLFREPHVFDVIVAPNLYGDIISDGAAALVGSLGVVPSANVGDTFVVTEPVHGSAPDIAGQNKANPIACIRSAAILLDHLGLPHISNRIQRAVDSVLREGRVLTPDLGGTASTQLVTNAIIERLGGPE